MLFSPSLPYSPLPPAVKYDSYHKNTNDHHRHHHRNHNLQSLHATVASVTVASVTSTTASTNRGCHLTLLFFTTYGDIDLKKNNVQISVVDPRPTNKSTYLLQKLRRYNRIQQSHNDLYCSINKSELWRFTGVYMIAVKKKSWTF